MPTPLRKWPNGSSALAELGVAGVNLEDGREPPERLVAKLRAARARLAGRPLFLNARCDCYLADLADLGDAAGREALTLARLQAYAEAGAEGVFVPGLADLAVAGRLAEAQPAALNLMALPGLPSLSALQTAGVRRLSMGPALFTAAYAPLSAQVQDLCQTGQAAIWQTELDYGRSASHDARCMLTLYGARDSGHSYKVRLALLLAGRPHRYERIDLGLPRAQRPEPFRSLSPYGEVPLLVQGAEVLAQSNAILLRLAEEPGPWAVPAAERDELRRWLFWEANRLGFSVPNLRFSRGWVAQPAAVEAWLEARARDDLDTLARHLSARDWILTQGPSVADLSLCAYLFWLPQAGLQAADWPAVQRWLARIQALPGWQAPDAVL